MQLFYVLKGLNILSFYNNKNPCNMVENYSNKGFTNLFHFLYLFNIKSWFELKTLSIFISYFLKQLFFNHFSQLAFATNKVINESYSMNTKVTKLFFSPLNFKNQNHLPIQEFQEKL